VKDIKLQFSRSTELESTIIASLCHGEFSHVDCDFGARGLLGASNSPKAPFLEGNPSGVAFRPPDYQPFAVRHTAIIRTTDDVADAFEGFAISQLGKGFDSSALSMRNFMTTTPRNRRDWRDNDLWFCSEFFTWCLEKARFWGYELLVAKDRITPGDLLLLVNPYMMNIDTFFDGDRK
jgi:hypothetical protein